MICSMTRIFSQSKAIPPQTVRPSLQPVTIILLPPQTVRPPLQPVTIVLLPPQTVRPPLQPVTSPSSNSQAPSLSTRKDPCAIIYWKLLRWKPSIPSLVRGQTTARSPYEEKTCWFSADYRMMEGKWYYAQVVRCGFILTVYSVLREYQKGVPWYCETCM